MVVCYAWRTLRFEEERYIRVGTPTSLKYCWVQMSVYYQIDSRRLGGKVQGEIGGKMIQSNLWYWLWWDFCSSSEDRYCENITVVCYQIQLTTTSIRCQECLFTWKSQRGGVYGRPARICHTTISRESVQIEEVIVWVEIVSKSMVW
jgi:hypothetical protein